MSLNNPGGVRLVGDGDSELNINYGPGYWIYFIKQVGEVVILVLGLQLHVCATARAKVAV